MTNSEDCIRLRWVQLDLSNQCWLRIWKTLACQIVHIWHEMWWVHWILPRLLRRDEHLQTRSPGWWHGGDWNPGVLTSASCERQALGEMPLEQRAREIFTLQHKILTNAGNADQHEHSSQLDRHDDVVVVYICLFSYTVVLFSYMLCTRTEKKTQFCVNTS